MKKKFAKVYLKYFLVLLVASFLIGGCVNTVTPNKVETHQTAFSGNSTNGGFVGFTADGFGILTSGKTAEYNALIEIYGKKFLPPIHENFGITAFTNGTYLITREGLSDFVQMKQWYKDGKK